MEKLRSVTMGIQLPQVAKEVVEALPCGSALRARAPETPLPDAGGVVAGVSQHLGDSHLTSGERVVVGVTVGIGGILIATDKSVAGMAAGEE